MNIATTEEVKVGDKIRMSVALIQDISEQPSGESPVVELREIRVDADGIKILFLDRV